jgi:hypothetical protein
MTPRHFDVLNRTDSDVIFTQPISNVTAHFDIVNRSGDILSDGNFFGQHVNVVLQSGDAGAMALEADEGTIGAPGNRLRVSMVRGKTMPDGSPSHMTGIQAGGPIVLTNHGALTVQEDVISARDITLPVPDTANPGDDRTVGDTLDIRSTGGSVNLLAGDNVQFRARRLGPERQRRHGAGPGRRAGGEPDGRGRRQHLRRQRLDRQRAPRRRPGRDRQGGRRPRRRLRPQR